jgi:Response regulator containing a CheY-like receiver domain and an HTH DNA-binding domain
MLFFQKISATKILIALKEVYEKDFFLPESLQKQLNQKNLLRDQFVDRLKLTKREIEIIKSIATGSSSHQIATELNVSTHTIETHRKNIFRKLNISNVAELVHFAHENYLI